MFAELNDPNNWTLGASNIAGDNQSAASLTFTVDCFAAGTMIATPGGEVAVETLQIGDMLCTMDGRVVPFTWVGRQTVMKRFARERAQLVRIKAGALGNHSDLFVTPDHGMVLNGFVINAAALVNGHGIDFVPLHETPAVQTVYHVETQAHEVIFANGCPAESYLPIKDRSSFDNHREYLDIYGADRLVCEMDLPRICTARLLPFDVKAKLGMTRPSQKRSA